MDLYRVRYGSESYEVAKSSEFRWAGSYSSPSSGGPELGQVTMQVQQLAPEHGVFGDPSVLPEYIEICIFHELREWQYANSGFEDAHERAVNDELLYTLKFFEEDTRQGYFHFAKRYREVYAFADIVRNNIVEKQGTGYAFFCQYSEVPSKERKVRIDVDAFTQWVIEELVDNPQLQDLYVQDGHIDLVFFERAERVLTSDTKRMDDITDVLLRNGGHSATSENAETLATCIRDGLHTAFSYLIDSKWKSIDLDGQGKTCNTIDELFGYVRGMSPEARNLLFY